MYREFSKKNLSDISELENLLSEISHKENLRSTNISTVRELCDPNVEMRLSVPKSGRYDIVFLTVGWLYVLAVNPVWKHEYQLYLWEACSKKNYQGKWKKLFHISMITSYELLLDMLMEQHGPDSFMGNYIPLLRRIAKSNCIKFCLHRKSLPRKTNRFGGYRDKGSMRFPHEWIPKQCVSGPNPEKDNLSENLDNRSLYVYNYMCIEELARSKKINNMKRLKAQNLLERVNQDGEVKSDTSEPKETIGIT